MVKILFVCMGNICRSPTAEGVFRQILEREGLADRVVVDSAGTGAWHVGSSPDARAQAAARLRGIRLDHIRGRQICEADFEEFDHILAMDRHNLRELLSLSDSRHHHKIRLFMEYSPELGIEEVPDPYYGGESGFDRVLDMIEAASSGLLEDLRGRLR